MYVFKYENYVNCIYVISGKHLAWVLNCAPFALSPKLGIHNLFIPSKVDK